MEVDKLDLKKSKFYFAEMFAIEILETTGKEISNDISQSLLSSLEAAIIKVDNYEKRSGKESKSSVYLKHLRWGKLKNEDDGGTLPGF